eukprot:8427277-Pyramimonas_sp.AAC.1
MGWGRTSPRALLLESIGLRAEAGGQRSVVRAPHQVALAHLRRIGHSALECTPAASSSHPQP